MLEFIRSHQRLAQVILLLFIVPSFAFVGLESYSRFRDSADTVAKVAGHSITQQEWDEAQREQMDRLRQMFGPQFNQKMLETPEFKQGVLENMIAQRVLAAEAASNYMTVSDQTLQQTILNISGLRSADGKFDSERYKSVLAAQGMTPAMYEARLRRDLVMQQISGATRYSSFVPQQVAARISDIGAQEREVQELAFKAADHLSKVKVTDDALREYYTQHSPQFTIPEQIQADYVILDAETVASKIAVTDADIKSYYDQNAGRYSTPEQRRASHILIAANKDATEADKAAAKAKAEDILGQLRKNPGSFAKLAKEYSQDPGSATKGGDLNFFAKGMMVKPFEEAAFKLKQGEISDLVQSDFGYHIIMVTGIKPAIVKPLQTVRNDIANDIRKQLLSKKYAEMAEIFSNTVYEQADSLKPVAEKLNLKIQKVSGLTRQPNPALGANSPVNNPKFLQAIFSDDATRNKRNSEAIEIAPQVMIAGHVTEYHPATVRPFEEVKSVIQERVKLEEAAKLAKTAGEEKLAKLQANGDTSGFSAPRMVSRTKGQGLDNAALASVMKADTGKLPAYVGATYPLQGYAIYRINKVVTPKNIAKERLQAEQQQMAQIVSQQEMSAYISALRQKYKVEILKRAAGPAAAEEKK
jgi:peptidyl-prolyl cis-trans isomerase D